MAAVECELRPEDEEEEILVSSSLKKVVVVANWKERTVEINFRLFMFVMFNCSDLN